MTSEIHFAKLKYVYRSQKQPHVINKIVNRFINSKNITTALRVVIVSLRVSNHQRAIAALNRR